MDVAAKLDSRRRDAWYSARAMPLHLRKRGETWWLEGRVEIRGARVRLSLGTREHAAAELWLRKVREAFQEGPASPYWTELGRVLPPLTLRRLRELRGWPTAQEKPATWTDLERQFGSHLQQRIVLGKLRPSTETRYKRTVKEFGKFLSARGVSRLRDIGRALVEDFKTWRVEQTKEHKQSRPGGRGVVLDAAILHRVFGYAIECELLTRNPVRLEGRPGDNPEAGAQPFKAEDLRKLREHAGADLLAFLLLRHTGLRGSDVVLLRWEEIDWDAREISRLTLKRSKRVVLPIHSELFFALEAERMRRDPKPLDRVLWNPATGKPLTRPRLYERIVALGRRAGVPHAHPHRFRDTLAVDLLAKGMNAYDVAKLLGDTVDTVERHYAPFVRELRERARRIMESGEGLEKTSGTVWAQPPARPRRPN